MKLPNYSKIENPKKRPFVHPDRKTPDGEKIFEVKGYAMVPVECRMFVLAWDREDAVVQAHRVWNEQPLRRHEWVISGTSDERHPDDWRGYAEPYSDTAELPAAKGGAFGME